MTKRDGSKPQDIQITVTMSEEEYDTFTVWKRSFDQNSLYVGTGHFDSRRILIVNQDQTVKILVDKIANCGAEIDKLRTENWKLKNKKRFW